MVINNRVINEPLENILFEVRQQTGKLEKIITRNDEIQVTCPFHADGKESRPSCFIRVEDGVFHCFTCSTAGSFSKFIGGCFGRSEEFGQQWLLRNYAQDYISSELKLEKIDLTKKNDEYLDESILDKFESYHPYMKQRKLTDEIIEKFQIKYDPEFRGIVFPVRDINGKLKFLTRRSVESKKFIIDKGANKKDIYLLNDCKNCRDVIVCESQFNALTSWAYGKPAIALFGCGTPQEQIDELNKTGIRHFILMYDNDKAGRLGAERFKRLINKDRLITDIVMPLGKDVNDLSKEEFYKLLKENYCD